MGRTATQYISKDFVRWGDTCAGVNHEQADVRHIDCALGQAAHAALQAVVGGLFQTGRVDHGEPQGAQPRFAFTQVAGHAGLVINQRQPFSHEPVKQGGLAHIRAANDGESE